MKFIYFFFFRKVVNGSCSSCRIDGKMETSVEYDLHSIMCHIEELGAPEAKVPRLSNARRETIVISHLFWRLTN